MDTHLDVFATTTANPANAARQVVEPPSTIKANDSLAVAAFTIASRLSVNVSASNRILLSRFACSRSQAPSRERNLAHGCQQSIIHHILQSSTNPKMTATPPTIPCRSENEKKADRYLPRDSRRSSRNGWIAHARTSSLKFLGTGSRRRGASSSAEKTRKRPGRKSSTRFSLSRGQD
jgi:hypothetical protein